MDYSVNTTTFPTIVHRSIYQAAVNLRTPEEMLRYLPNASAKVRDGCREYHAFMFDMFSDMCENPEAYGMRPGYYEAFLNGRKHAAVARITPAKLEEANKDSSIVATYEMFLSDVAKASQDINGEFFLPHGGIDKYPGWKNKLVPYDIRREGFRRAGFTWEERPDGTVQLFSEQYPHMLTAISAWVKADKKRKLSFEDVVSRTADESRAILETVHKMALQAKLKPQYPDNFCDTWIDYKYKTKRALRIQPGIVLRNNQWQIATLVRLWGSPRPEFLERISEQGEDFVRYFNRHLNYCGACNPEHIKSNDVLQIVLGRRVRLCSCPGSVFYNPTTQDLPYIQKLIEIQKEEIEDMLSNIFT
jgi:hypothetical protein